MSNSCNKNSKNNCNKSNKSNNNNNKITLTSQAFKIGATIPVIYTCQGTDISPELKWSKVACAKSYAITCLDPDAPKDPHGNIFRQKGIWVHWIAYNISPNITSLNANASQLMAGKFKQGLNSWETVGYRGPCPPIGETHRYFFKVYALDTVIDCKNNKEIDIVKFTNKIESHVIACGQTMGRYKMI